MKKSIQLVNSIKKNESPPVLLNEFLSNIELLQLKKWYQKCLQVEEFNSFRLDNNENNDITSMPQNDLKNEIIKFLKQKIEPIINPDNELEIEFEIAYHSNKKAYGIHTDSGYDPSEKIFKQGIIPIEINPLGGKTHTVLLNQKCYHSSSFPLIEEDISAQSNVEGLDFKCDIPKEVYREFWKPTEDRRKQMRGFSICYPYEWVIGSTVIWDRAHVHCSSDFEVTGTISKLGLMWISRILNQ